MPTSVLYHCNCQHGSSSVASISGSTTSSSPSLTPPILPSYTSAPEEHTFHALDSLYFCEECDAVRCTLCVDVEISAFYCPTCLFEVPGASVKGERNRCARNCFTCPCCTHTLTLQPSDVPKSKDGTPAPDPLSAAASIGGAPYLLTCDVCKWDSKEIGMSFEKSTGLSLQLQRYEDAAPDVLELDSLRSHFDPFVRAQTEDPAELAAAAAAATTSSSSAAAALRKSKLLRDVPALAADPRYLGAGVGGARGARKALIGRDRQAEVLRPYEARTSWVSGANSKGEGVVSRRDESRATWMARMSNAEQASTLEQRWTSAWDQPVRASELRPSRVLLKAKQTKRCPACRHIIIKPDIKSASKRYKIRLVAMSYLPDIFVLPVAGVLSPEDARAKRQSTLAMAAAARRRPQSVLGTPSITGSSATSIDEENLVAGRNYSFEATFTNPLDDAMDVRLGIALPDAALPAALANSPIMLPTSPPLVATQVAEPPRSPSSPTRATPLSPTGRGTPLSPTRASQRPIWNVVPSSTSFPISAFNEVWELDDDDADLLDGTGLRGGAGDDDVDDDGEVGRRLAEGDEDDMDIGGAGRDYKKSRTSTGGARTRRKRDGIVRRKGNATTIAFDLELGKEASGEIEFALYVSYSYKPEADEVGPKSRSPPASGQAESDKTFSFWCAVRLGKCVGRKADEARAAADSGSRAANLDKRRSMLFGGGAATAETPTAAIPASSTLVPALEEQEEGEALPRGAGNLATQL